jgi:hypothetical protein
MNKHPMDWIFQNYTPDKRLISQNIRNSNNPLAHNLILKMGNRTEQDISQKMTYK